MIASVAVLRRFPRTKGLFDYVVPEGLAVQAGSFVQVPFGKRRLDGIVLSVSQHSDVAQLKAIERVYDDPPFSKTDLAFYNAIAIRTYQSVASVLYAAIPERPKRPSTVDALVIEGVDRHVRSFMAADIRRAVRAMSSSSFLQISVPSEAFAEAVVLSALHRLKGPTRVICPDMATLSRMHSALLTHHRVTLLHGGQLKNQQWASFVEARAGSHDVLLTTRLGALVPAPSHVATFILQSGSRDLAQHDQNPHYDSRWCTKCVHEQTRAATFFLDVLPRLEDGSVDLDLWRAPERLQLIDMAHQKRPFGFSEALVTYIENTSPSELFLVYHNRVGDARLLMCRTCEYRWMCTACHRPFRVDGSSLVCATCKAREVMPTACPACHGTNITSSGVGIKELASRLQRTFPNREVTTLQSKGELPVRGIVVVTDAIWTQNIPPMAGVAVPYLEHVFVHTGFDAHYRAQRTVRRLAGLAYDHAVPCIVQAWDAALLSESFRPTHTILKAEASVRSLLGYPPFSNLVTVRNTKTGSVETRRLSLGAVDETLASLPPSFDISVR